MVVPWSHGTFVPDSGPFHSHSARNIISLNSQRYRKGRVPPIPGEAKAPDMVQVAEMGLRREALGGPAPGRLAEGLSRLLG